MAAPECPGSDGVRDQQCDLLAGRYGIPVTTLDELVDEGLALLAKDKEAEELAAREAELTAESAAGESQGGSPKAKSSPKEKKSKSPKDGEAERQGQGRGGGAGGPTAMEAAARAAREYAGPWRCGLGSSKARPTRSPSSWCSFLWIRERGARGRGAARQVVGRRRLPRQPLLLSDAGVQKEAEEGEEAREAEEALETEEPRPEPEKAKGEGEGDES